MRQVIVLSVALTASLVGAYLTWTDEGEEVSDEAVVVLSGSPADLVGLTWKGEDDITVVRKSDAKGEYLWVEAIERTKKPIKKPDTDHPELDPTQDEPEDDGHGHDHGDEDHDEDEPEEKQEAPGVEYEIEEKTVRFLGNAQAQELWESFAPLEALRELEATPEMDRAAFGFDEPTATLSVSRKKGQPAELVLGGETYGSKDRYLEHQGRIFLVDDATIRPLQFATSRLVERSLQPISQKDVTKVEVSLPDGTVATFEQHDADDPAKAFWARPETPDKADETAATWLDKVFRLRLRGYVDESEVTAPMTSQVELTVHGADQSWKISILSADGEKTEWYARSEYNRSLVSLTESLARNVIDDLEALQQ